LTSAYRVASCFVPWFQSSLIVAWLLCIKFPIILLLCAVLFMRHMLFICILPNLVKFGEFCFIWYAFIYVCYLLFVFYVICHFIDAVVFLKQRLFVHNSANCECTMTGWFFILKILSSLLDSAYLLMLTVCNF